MAPRLQFKGYMKRFYVPTAIAFGALFLAANGIADASRSRGQNNRRPLPKHSQVKSQSTTRPGSLQSKPTNTRLSKRAKQPNSTESTQTGKKIMDRTPTQNAVHKWAKKNGLEMVVESPGNFFTVYSRSTIKEVQKIKPRFFWQKKIVTTHLEVQPTLTVWWTPKGVVIDTVVTDLAVEQAFDLRKQLLREFHVPGDIKFSIFPEGLTTELPGSQREYQAL